MTTPTLSYCLLSRLDDEVDNATWIFTLERRGLVFENLISVLLATTLGNFGTSSSYICASGLSTMTSLRLQQCAVEWKRHGDSQPSPISRCEEP